MEEIEKKVRELQAQIKLSDSKIKFLLDQQLEVPEFTKEDNKEEDELKRKEEQKKALQKYVLSVNFDKMKAEFQEIIGNLDQRLSGIEPMANMFTQGITIAGKTVTDIDNEMKEHVVQYDWLK